MKCRDFRDALIAFADLLDIAGAPVARDHITLFAAPFDAHATSTVSDLVKILAALPRTASTGNPRLGEVVRLLVALKSALNKTAKTVVASDVIAVEKLLADRASMELGAFVQMVAGATSAIGCRTGSAAGMRDELIAQYEQKLEATLGDDERFAAIYNDLRTDIGMRKPENCGPGQADDGQRRAHAGCCVKEDLEPPPVPGSVQGEIPRHRGAIGRVTLSAQSMLGGDSCGHPQGKAGRPTVLTEEGEEERMLARLKEC
jgi:hypothetical protein